MTVKIQRIITQTFEITITDEKAFEQDFWPELEAGVQREQVLKIVALKQDFVRQTTSGSVSVKMLEKSEAIIL